MAAPTLNNPQQVLATATGNTVTITSYTPTAGATSNSKLVVFASCSDNNDSGETVTSVTYAGNNLTEVAATQGHHRTGAIACFGSFWLTNNPLNLAASGNVVATASANANAMGIWAATILNTETVKAFSALPGSNLDTDAATPLPLDVTTVVNDTLVISGCHLKSNSALTLDTASATEHNDTGGTNIRQGVGSIVDAVAGTQNMQWSASTTQAPVVANIGLEPVAAAAGGMVPPLRWRSFQHMLVR